MSIDPINPGYLDHIFDGALREPRRIERIDGQNERQRSEEESARRRSQGRGDSYGGEEFDAQTADDGDGDDDRDERDFDEAAAGSERLPSTVDDDHDERFDDALVEAELVEDSAVTVSSSADAAPDLDIDQNGEEDEDAVVVEFDSEEPSPLIERRRNEPHDGHIDFEA